MRRATRQVLSEVSEKFVCHSFRTPRRLFRKTGQLTRLAPARPLRRLSEASQDAPFHGQGRSEVRDAKTDERHVCGRARVGERPVSEKARRTQGGMLSL
jgi:hypothetical protein